MMWKIAYSRTVYTLYYNYYIHVDLHIAVHIFNIVESEYVIFNQKMKQFSVCVNVGVVVVATMQSI